MYGVGSQVGGYPWWREQEATGGPRALPEASDVLFLDVDAGFAGVFTL